MELGKHLFRLPFRLQLAGIGLSVTAVILLSVGVALPYWLDAKFVPDNSTSVTVHAGLWGLCLSTAYRYGGYSATNKQCGDYYSGMKISREQQIGALVELRSVLDNTRGLELSSLSLIAVGLVIAAVHVLFLREQRIHLEYVEAGLLFLAGWLAVAGNVVFLVNWISSILKDSEYDVIGPITYWNVLTETRLCISDNYGGTNHCYKVTSSGTSHCFTICLLAGIIANIAGILFLVAKFHASSKVHPEKEVKLNIGY